MKRVFLKYTLPAFIVGIAAIQFHQVYHNNLTRWKGGGFGMYSEMHPLRRQIWIQTTDSIFDVKKISKLFLISTRLKLQPNKNNGMAFAEKAAAILHKDSFTVEVWEPYFDVKTNRLGRLQIQEIKYAP